jgi:ADP-heptose:LPS heptosyltransferase
VDSLSTAWHDVLAMGPTSMKKAIGFNGGMYGDSVIMTVAARAFKQQFPDAHLTFAVNRKFDGIMPLFAHNPNIDAFHSWDGYDAAFPNKADQDYIAFQRFDHVFNQMAGHVSQDWYNHRHYAEEACVRHGLKPPADLSYELVKWFPRLPGCERYVTLSLFPSKGGQMDKTMPVPECEKLCLGLRAMGYTPVQLGGRFEVKLENAVAPDFSILEAAQVLTSSAFHITADTAFASIAAGYKHPTIGFYSRNYPDMVSCESHLPPNPNAIYFKNRVLKDLTAEEILAVVEIQRLGGRFS